MFIDWEGRPAVLVGDTDAYSIVSSDGGWESVSRFEVIDSGTPMSESAFLRMFPYARISDIPGFVHES